VGRKAPLREDLCGSDAAFRDRPAGVPYNRAVPFLEGRALSKTYRNAEVPVVVFSDLDLDVEKGEMLAVMGPSGIGKSTLLHLLGGLDRADSGRVQVDEKDLTAMSKDELARFRNRNVGFVFQFHHLLPEFSAVENVAMPGWIGRFDRQEALDRAAELLAVVSSNGWPLPARSWPIPCSFWPTSRRGISTWQRARKCSI
jgi:ABC-type proline/glycine betaine transport system ATPase subunit